MFVNQSHANYSVLSDAKTDIGSPVEEFATIIANMNLLSSRLPRTAPFFQSELGVAEWIAMSVLRRSGSLNNTQLARTLGFSRQRAHQIITKLDAAKLITVYVSTEDSRENIVSLTENGQKQIEALNTEVLSLLNDALGSKTANLHRLRKQLVQLHIAIRNTGKSPAKSDSSLKQEGARRTEIAGAPVTRKQKRLFGLLRWRNASQNRGG